MIRNKENPLSKASFIPRSLFLWCNDCINSSKERPWTQEMNYDLPDFDKLSHHKERLEQNLNKYKKLLPAILMSYKKETMILVIGQILLSVYKNYAIKVVSDSYESMSVLELYNNAENLKTVILKLFGGSLMVALGVVVDENIQFYSRRISLGARSSLFSIMQDKIMRFSTLNSEKITDGFIADLIQVDIVFLKEMYFNLNLIFGALVGLVTSLSFMVIFLGFWQTVIFLVFLAILLSLYHFCYAMQAYIRKHYLEAKDKRMSLLRNILENIDYVKINGLETYFCLDIYERREKEISWMKALSVVMTFEVSILSTTACWYFSMVFNLVWLLFPFFNMNLAKFFEFYNYGQNITKSLTEIILGYSYYLKMMVSIERIDLFLGENDKKFEAKKEISLSRGGSPSPQQPQTVLRIKHGNFIWRVGEYEQNVLITAQTEKKRKEQESELAVFDMSESENSASEYLLTHELNSSRAELIYEKTDSPLKTQKKEFQKTSKFMIRDVNLRIKKGEKIGVIGDSGSGTSSLLYCMIGEMIPLDSAQVYKQGSISYLSQSRWLIGASIKENILLGKHYDQNLMQLALEAADLLEDINQFSDGIETVLSDNGDSVSGGQRARIALARCFYQDTDIMILDDPTSSLDNKVTAYILDLIMNHPKWSQKTYVIATRKMQILDQFDRVIYMENGSIKLFAPYSELREFPEFRIYEKDQKLQKIKIKMSEQLPEEEEEKEEEEEEKVNQRKLNLSVKKKGHSFITPIQSGAKAPNNSFLYEFEVNSKSEIHSTPKNAKQRKKRQNQSIFSQSNKKLINLNAIRVKEEEENPKNNESEASFFVKEKKATGLISLKLLHYVTKHTIGYQILILCLVSASLSGFWNVKITEANNSWGVEYFDSTHPHHNPVLFNHFYIYTGLAIVTSMVGVLPTYYSITWFGRRVHSNMVFSLLHSRPTEFLQRTPNGVILNRFSNDVNIMDNELIGNFYQTLASVMVFLVTAVDVLYKMTNILGMIPILAFQMLGFRLRQTYMRAQADVKRLTLISKSPIIGTAVSSIQGSPVIRVLGRQSYLRDKIDYQIDENTKNFVMFYGLHSWFNCLQEFYKLFIIFWPMYFLILYTQYTTPSKEKGLVTQIQLIEKLAMSSLGIFLTSVEFEKAMISVERLREYESIEPESGYKSIEEDSKLFMDIRKSKYKKILEYLKISKMAKSFQRLLIQEGEIRLSGVSARYPTSKKEVLKELDLVIPGGQRVGVVGRSGVGKSSFLKLLWRALDPSQGTIEIDGKDLVSLDVKEYRREVNAILQKPCLFEGTLLSNICESSVTAHQIEAIRKELMSLGFPLTKLQESDLSYKVKEGGSNLSQSEKQIISLMRALQKESRVVILDEATAYVDTSLEKKFQERLYRKFRDSTMLIIAHRISNVMDADRVLVFDQGRIVEDGHPRELMKNVNGIFYDIVRKG